MIAGKIEMVKSKWGLALSAMATVVASLIMSVSLCVFFGLTPSLSGRQASEIIFFFTFDKLLLFKGIVSQCFSDGETA